MFFKKKKREREPTKAGKDNVCSIELKATCKNSVILSKTRPRKVILDVFPVNSTIIIYEVSNKNCEFMFNLY